MAEVINNNISVIKQNDPDTPEYLDFEKLRREGLEHIGNLSGKIWTDHNVHDPGVTILEVLVYALMDLGYKTNLPFEDLIAIQNSTTQEDNFLTPLEVLTINPVTITDYRKLVLEVKGVRNAWLEPATQQEVALYLNPNTNTLSCKNTSSNESKSTNARAKGASDHDICLNGLYKIYIEKDNDTITTDILLNELKLNVKNLLARHRNLCEDFIDEIEVLTPLNIGICVEVEIHVEYVAEKVYAEIFRRIKNYIQPEIKYYTLEELLDKGRTIDDIFAGRPYKKESFGFVDTEEIENFDRREKIYLSDLYDVILTIDGVRKIKNITVKGDQALHRGGSNWEFVIPENYVPAFSLEKTCIDLYTVQGALQIDKPRVHRAFGVMKQFEMPLDALNTQVPLGNYRANIERYYSIQNDFPTVYGVGEDGLPERAGLLRETQALQLKGYLMFYDQILANYTSQLANIRSLFSLKPEDQRTEEEKRTYFTQIPDSVPGLQKIIRSYEQNKSLLDGSQLAVPVANNSQWQNALEKLENNPGVVLTITRYCDDTTGLVDAFNFSSAGVRTIYINQLIDSFFNNKYTINIKTDRRGHFFVIQVDLPDDILIVSTKRFNTTGEALKGAKNLAFIATMSQSYNEITNASDTITPDQHYFDITHSTLSYVNLIQGLTEDKEEYLIRRKQLLDHLLARFGEEFTDYAILQFQNKIDAEAFKEDEVNSQSKYVNTFAEVSRNRGKAFNYLEPSWNTDNVSGFEKRVSLLSGIENYHRRNLCNFEVTQTFRIILEDWSGNILFRSNSAYATTKELQDASKTILAQLRHPESYKQLGKSLNGFDNNQIQRIFSEKPEKDNIIITKYYYHQQLKNCNDIPIAKSKSEKMRSEKSGVEKKEAFVSTINEQNLLSAAKKDKKYRLLPLDSENRYLDVSELACDIDTLISWRWHVKDQNAKEKAVSDLVFKTEDDAWDNMIQEAKLDRYLTTHDVAHTWKLKINKDISIQGVDCYPDTSKCVTAWRQAKMLGSSEKNFDIENKGGANIIRLKNKKGKIIAVSNEFAPKTTNQKDILLHCASVFNNRRTRPDFDEETEKIGFQILGKDNTPVLTSYCVYDSKKEAIQQIPLVFKLGTNKKNYLLSGDEGNSVYNFILKDEYDSFLTLPPDHFETATDRTKVLNTMMRYFKSNDLPVFVKEEPRSYVWTLVQDQKKVLSSTSEFTSKTKAQSDFDNAIVIEALKENNTLCAPHFYEFEVIATPAQYKFVYGDNDAQHQLEPIFISTNTFATSEAASKAYTDFMRQLPGLVFKNSSEKDGDFGLYLSDSNTPVVIAYPKKKPSVSKARNMTSYITKIYAKNLEPKDSFITKEIVARQNESYEWRFYKKNAPIAISPYRCDSESQAENIKTIVCDKIPPVNLKKCPKKRVVVCPEGDPNKFHYQITFNDDQDNEFVLISYVGYNSVEEAEEAWENEWLDVIKIATDPEEYTLSRKINIEETYDDPTKKSCDQASFIAVIPNAIRAQVGGDTNTLIAHYTALADLFPIYKISDETEYESNAQYAFKVVVPQKDLIPEGCRVPDTSTIDHIGSLLWLSTDSYTDLQETIDAYQYFYNVAGVSYNCRMLCEKGAFYIGLLEILAESAIEFDTIKDAWDDKYPGRDNDKDDCQNCVPGGVREFIYAAEEDKNYIPVCELNYWNFKVVAPSYFVSEHTCNYDSTIERDEQMKSWLTKLESLDWDRYTIWQTDEGESTRKEGMFFSQIGYGYSSEEFCKLVFACRDSIQQCTEKDEDARVEGIKASLKEKYKEDSDVSRAIDSQSFLYQDICDLVNYFPVYSTENGYRYRLYWPENDVITTPEGLQPCGCNDTIENEQPCKEPYPFISSTVYTCCAEALNAFNEFCALMMQGSYSAEYISKTEYGPHSFEIINKKKELAYHPQRYESLQEVKNAIAHTKASVNDVGMHLLEHILLRPKSEDQCGNIIEDNESEGRKMLHCLLPVCPDNECLIEWQPDIDQEDPCADNNPDTIHYIPGSDPYSFWATLVLPGWHKQFRTAEQRQGFEKFLYTEAPALVGLNILWLSPWDLCKFEDKYRKWLAWKQDVSALSCYPKEHHPNCLLSDCIRTLESEPPCPTVPGQDGDCNCNDDQRDNTLPEDITGSIFWGNCEPDGPILGSIEEINVSAKVAVRKATLEAKKADETLAKVATIAKKEQPKVASSKKSTKKAASSVTKKAAVKKAVPKKSAAKKSAVKKPTKDTLATIRKRKPKYMGNIEAAADSSMKKTKSYERTVFFLQNTPTVAGFTKLVDFFNKYSLQKDNNTEGFLILLKNATWHLLDKLVLDKKEALKKEVIDELNSNLTTLSKKGLLIKELDKEWNSNEVKEVANAEVLAQLKKLLK